MKDDVAPLDPDLWEWEETTVAELMDALKRSVAKAKADEAAMKQEWPEL